MALPRWRHPESAAPPVLFSLRSNAPARVSIRSMLTASKRALVTEQRAKITVENLVCPEQVGLAVYRREFASELRELNIFRFCQFRSSNTVAAILRSSSNSASSTSARSPPGGEWQRTTPDRIESGVVVAVDFHYQLVLRRQALVQSRRTAGGKYVHQHDERRHFRIAGTRNMERHFDDRCLCLLANLEAALAFLRWFHGSYRCRLRLSRDLAKITLGERENIIRLYRAGDGQGRVIGGVIDAEKRLQVPPVSSFRYRTASRSSGTGRGARHRRWPGPVRTAY